MMMFAEEGLRTRWRRRRRRDDRKMISIHLSTISMINKLLLLVGDLLLTAAAADGG
jgi:hypothetical protein